MDIQEALSAVKYDSEKVARVVGVIATDGFIW